VAVEPLNQVLSGDAMRSLLRKSMLVPAPFENEAAHQTRRWFCGAGRKLRVLHLHYLLHQ
jgi:hypothetical protein